MTGREAPRVLFWGHLAGGRRVRMCTKVIAELRRRRRHFLAICYGPVGEEAMRLAPPDELHEDLTAPELLRLFQTSSAILEPVDRDDLRSPAGALGLALGIPTICHRDAALPGCVSVDEWSADAFADAIVNLEPVTSRGASSPDPAVLIQFEKALLGHF